MTAELEVFARYDADASDADMIVMGVKDAGGAVIASLRLPAGAATAAIMSALKPKFDITSAGYISFETDIIDDAELMDMHRSGALPSATLDNLIADHIALARSVPDNETSDELERFASTLDKLAEDLRAAARAVKDKR